MRRAITLGLAEAEANRAGIVIGSLANDTPVTETRPNFLGRLAHTTRALDHLRLPAMDPRQFPISKRRSSWLFGGSEVTQCSQKEPNPA